MSTKIWTAYRLKRSKDLWPFIRDTRSKGEANVVKTLRKLMLAFASEVDVTSEAYKKALEYADNKEPWARLKVANNAITEGYRAQLGKYERNPFHFDVSITIREHKDRLYILPYCDWTMADVLDFLKRDKRLENFAYWDNTDKPSHITHRAWDARGKVWDAIHDAGWRDYLALDICKWESFYLIDPYMDMVREMIRKEKREAKAKSAAAE